jgi:hypothetical protein
MQPHSQHLAPISHDPIPLTSFRHHPLAETRPGSENDRVDLAFAMKTPLRVIVWRMIGVLLAAGSLFGLVVVVQNPAACTAIIDWITLGKGVQGGPHDVQKSFGETPVP